MFNGLLTRPDWKDTENIPYGVIPLGSGNGMARSLAHYNQEPYTYDPLVISVLNVVKLRTIQLNICIVNTAYHKVIYQNHIRLIYWRLIEFITIETCQFPVSRLGSFRWHWHWEWTSQIHRRSSIHSLVPSQIFLYVSPLIINFTEWI